MVEQHSPRLFIYPFDYYNTPKKRSKSFFSFEKTVGSAKNFYPTNQKG